MEDTSLSDLVAAGIVGWAGSILPTVPSLIVATAVWVIDASVVVELAGISVRCGEGSLACGSLGVGFSALEVVDTSFAEAADDARLG